MFLTRSTVIAIRADRPAEIEAVYETRREITRRTCLDDTRKRIRAPIDTRRSIHGEFYCARTTRGTIARGVEKRKMGASGRRQSAAS